jgi:hypothetical protein
VVRDCGLMRHRKVSTLRGAPVAGMEILGKGEKVRETVRRHLNLALAPAQEPVSRMRQSRP